MPHTSQSSFFLRNLMQQKVVSYASNSNILPESTPSELRIIFMASSAWRTPITPHTVNRERTKRGVSESLLKYSKMKTDYGGVGGGKG